MNARRRENLNPLVPEFERPRYGRGLMQRYKVAEVGEFQPDGQGLSCVLKLTNDGGSGVFEFTVHADTEVLLKGQVSTIQKIAENEEKARKSYGLGYRRDGKSYLLVANKLRQNIIGYGVQNLPAREWNPPEDKNIIAWQEELF